MNLNLRVEKTNMNYNMRTNANRYFRCSLPMIAGFTSPILSPGTSSVVTVISELSGPSTSKSPSSLNCASFPNDNCNS